MTSGSTLVVFGLVVAAFATACSSASTATPEPTAPAPSAATPTAPANTLPQPTATVPANVDRLLEGAIEPDPNYQEALAQSRISTRGWKTDFSRHTVPFNEILWGGVPRDGIPPIDNPKFDSVSQADQWLAGEEPVVAIEVGGQAKGYPVQILTSHEIVNDAIGDQPVSVTFCPLCNSAVAFDRRVEGEVFDFGVSGNLRNSDLIMWDRQTESWWQQLTGKGIVGIMAGKQLRFIPAQMLSWRDFKAAYPDATVLNRDTGFSRSYGSNPYVGYDDLDQTPFLFLGDPDRRLQPMERVVALQQGDQSIAFPYAELRKDLVVHRTVGGKEIVVFFEPTTRSALDRRDIATSKQVGSAGVFEPIANGQALTFQPDGERFTDVQTGSTWAITGKAIAGPLSGAQLPPVLHGNHFWFAWAAFQPNTEIYRSS